MEYRKLGRTGLDVSVLGIGTNDFGRRTDFERTKAILHTCLDLGVNFIDTANVYADTHSEEFIGKIIGKTAQRSEVIIATKVGVTVAGRGAPSAGPNSANQRGGSRHHIIQQLERSLRRLQTDYVDVYYLHRWDPETPIEETLRAFDDLIRQGKVRYIGASNAAAWQLTGAMWTARTHNLHQFSCVQFEYNILSRDIEYDIVPFCEEYGVGLVPYYPLACGLLTGKHRPGHFEEGSRLAGGPWTDVYRSRFVNERNWGLLEQLESFAAERRHSVTELAFAWLIAHPIVRSVTAGATSPEQVEANAKACEWKLSPQDREDVRVRLSGLPLSGPAAI
jgi:aryl-alcohol dehydrogenase-like predicted oxidoreductase